MITSQIDIFKGNTCLARPKTFAFNIPLNSISSHQATPDVCSPHPSFISISFYLKVNVVNWLFIVLTYKYIK